MCEASIAQIATTFIKYGAPRKTGCYNCAKEGHMGDQCEEPCKYCPKKVPHMRKDCPEAAKQRPRSARRNLHITAVFQSIQLSRKVIHQVEDDQLQD